MSNVSKHKMTFLSLTKSLTVAVFMLIFYPFILATQGAFCQNKPVDEALTNIVLLVIIISGMWGYLCGKIESRINAKSPNRKAVNRMITRVTIFCFVTIPIVVMSIMLDMISGYFLVSAIAICITAFIFGFIFWYKEYSEIIEKKAVLTYAVFNIVAIIALFFLKAQYSQNFIVIYYFVFIALFFITRNQSNIDYLMERRQHKLEHLPKKIRYYNLYLILAILAVILTAFLAKKPIANLFMIIIDYAKKLIKAIFDFINWLMNLFTKEGTSQIGASPSATTPMMPAEDQTSGFDWTYIIITLLVAGVIFIIVKNRKAIYRFFVRIFNKILSVVKKLLLNTPLSPSRGDESSDYYQDEAQSLDKNDIVANKKKKEFTHRDFKKQCKIYLSMADNEEKLLFGYQLMVKWFEVRGVDIIKSDTAIEILHKVSDKKMSEKDRLEIVTEFYNYIRFKKVRFSNQSLTELTTILSEMKQRNS